MKTQRRPHIGSVVGIAAALGTFGLLAMSASSAQAALTLKLSAGGPVTTVADGSVLDFSPAANEVLVAGLTVGGWMVNVNLARSSGVGFLLDITNTQTTSSAAGTLTVQVSDVGFATSTGSDGEKFVMQASYSLPSLAGGTITYTAYQSDSNTLFAQSRLIDSIAISGAGAVVGTGGDTLWGLTSPFSLTQVVTVTHNGAGTSSGNSQLRVPEPGTLGLLGVGLMLLGLMGRFHKVRRNATAE